MFRPRGTLPSTIVVLLLLLVTSYCQSNSRSYDTNDWIPVSRPCPTCFPNSDNQGELTQKKPTGRVLNLPAADQKRFFPEDQANIDPQLYRTSGKQYTSADTNHQLQPNRQQTQFSQQPSKVPDITTFVPGGQNVLLPPQLQNLISQGQPLLSPQRINSQLLQDAPFQQPLEDFRGNLSQYNVRDFDNRYDQRFGNQNVPVPQQQRQNIQPNFQQIPKQHSNNGGEEVQLLYVPLENLRPRAQKVQGQQVNFPAEQTYQPVQTFNQVPPASSHQYQSAAPHKQTQLHNIEQDFVQQALQAQKLQEQFQQNIQQPQPQTYRRPVAQDVTTAAPALAQKKRKPHQPPLAVYMGTHGHQDIKVTDVLSLLKDAKTISVQDSVGSDSPQVFVGPSQLEAPEGYVKFDLPYLSSIEGNRVERKVDQLPFFVAPLSYKAPPGYSKIPFPAPHVGSVVVNHMKEQEDQAQKEISITTEKAIVAEVTQVPTSRPRIRQRPPTRVSYPSSSIPPAPNQGDVPYHIQKESLPVHSQTIDSNPYGPTQFVQSTTPAYIPEDNPIPEQLFSTYGRFTTPTAYKSQDPVVANPLQYSPQPKQQASTEQPTRPPTQPDDKFTVLEQFPVPVKPNTEKYQQEDYQPRENPQQHYQHRGQQNKEYISNYENPASKVLYNNRPTDYVDQYQSAVPHAQFDTGSQNKQVYLEQYNRQVAPQIDNRNSYPTRHPDINQQPNRQQQSILQNQGNIGSYVDNIQHSKQRGQQPLVPENNYYIEQYTTERPHEETVRYDLPNKQTLQEVTSFDVPELNVQNVRTHLIRNRGKQHFTPQPEYTDDYEEQTKSVLRKQQAVTKAPTADYNVQVQTQPPVRSREEVQQTPEPYYRGEATPSQEQEQGFILPVQLPVITPQLPGLVNSLEDQAIRPLLAPLLIPPSEETPIVDSTSEHHTHPVTTTTTTTTTTPVPIIETTTQSKRLRSRYRGTRPTFSEYTNTTPTSRRPSQYRGRRPYSGRIRTEYNKPTQYLEEVTPTTNILHQEIPTEAPARSNIYAARNRFAIQRDRTYSSSTTEIPRRTVSSGRQRFRTRGRPVKGDEDYINVTPKSSTDNVASFKQPSLEGGFHASAPITQNNAYLPNAYTQIPQEDKKNLLVHTTQNTKPTVYSQEKVPVQASENDYSSEEKVSTQVQRTSIPVSAPENNVVGDAIHVDPALLPNQESHQVKYSQAFDVNPLIAQYTPTGEDQYNSNSKENQQTLNEYKEKTHSSAYVLQDEPESTVVTTTEIPRARSRTRSKQRSRGYSGSTTIRLPVHQPTTTSTVRTTTESKDESEEEFYGFFRQPNFATPEPVEYKETSDLRIPQKTVPNVAYLSREQDDQPIYVNTAQTLHDEYQPVEHSHEINVVSQVPSTTTVPTTTTTTTEETTVDIKPITRRPSSSFIRSRRPITVTQALAEMPTRAPEKYYTVRPSKRPESQTPKVTRIRGRIRKPTKPTTTPASVETEAPYASTQKPTQELNTQHEHTVPVRQRQRLYNRGRTHFQYTTNEKHLSTEEPESPNYPPNFLQAHGLPTPRPAALINIPQNPAEKPDLTSQEITPKPTFQLTIEPEDIEEEYVDQLPYSSVTKSKLSSKDLEDGAESQFSSKVVEKPNNYNFIRSAEKNISQGEEVKSSNENSTVTETKSQATTAKPEDLNKQSDTTTDETATTTEEPTTLKPKPRRKGYWRLVNQRPVGDEFESAESQNIGTVYENNLYDDEKPKRKYKTIQRTRGTTSSLKDVTTLTPEITTLPLKSQPDDSATLGVKLSRPEDEILSPLYEMFGLSYGEKSGSKMEELQTNAETTTQFSSTFDEYTERMETTTNNGFNSSTVTDVPSSAEDETLVYSDQVPQKQNEWDTADETWKSRIIGTSTTTEISHETEICYRGRCVKSTTSENSSEV